MSQTTALQKKPDGDTTVPVRKDGGRQHSPLNNGFKPATTNPGVKPPASNNKAVKSPLSKTAGDTESERQELLLRELRMRKERNKVRRRYVLMIFISFLFSIAVIYRYSFVIEINELIRHRNDTLTKMVNENSLLQKQIGVETDLEKIRLLAESKLDMHKPDKDQIVYIKVPKKDHALVAPSGQQQDTDALNPFAYLLEQARLIQKRLIAD